MEYVGFLASLAMGVTLGLLGGGGSILTVPILVYLFAISPTIATGYSLFIVGLTALMGSFVYIRQGYVDFRVGFVFAIPSVIGVNFSRGFVIPNIPAVLLQVENFVLTKEVLVMIVFAALMLTAAYSMIQKKQPAQPTHRSPLSRISLIALQGIIVGIIAGFIGAGGGFLIIPALVFMAGLSMKVAIGTSLMIIAIQSLLGFAGDLSRGLQVNWPLLGAVAVFAAIGIITGSVFAHKIKEQRLKTAFGWFVLFMGFVILIEQFRHIYK